MERMFFYYTLTCISLLPTATAKCNVENFIKVFDTMDIAGLGLVEIIFS